MTTHELPLAVLLSGCTRFWALPRHHSGIPFPIAKFESYLDDEPLLFRLVHFFLLLVCLRRTLRERVPCNLEIFIKCLL